MFSGGFHITAANTHERLPLTSSCLQKEKKKKDIQSASKQQSFTHKICFHVGTENELKMTQVQVQIQSHTELWVFGAAASKY